MKLVMIHLLLHFADYIQMYGSALNLNEFTGELHLKTKTKKPTCTTRICYIGMEYRTDLKDYSEICA